MRRLAPGVRPDRTHGGVHTVAVAPLLDARRDDVVEQAQLQLAMRLPRETAYSATDLLAERSWVDRYSQIRAFTSQDYWDLVDALDRHYNLLLVDTGTGILDDAIQGILEKAHQLVVVMPAGARRRPGSSLVGRL